MTSEENNKDSGKIKDRISNSEGQSKPKKKIVIKKKKDGQGQNKDIADLYRSKPQSSSQGPHKKGGPGGGASSPRPDNKGPARPNQPTSQDRSGTAGDGQRQRPQQPQQQRPQGGHTEQRHPRGPAGQVQQIQPRRSPVVKRAADRGIPPADNTAQRPRQPDRQEPRRGPAPNQQTPGRAPSAAPFDKAGTPFDSLVDSGKRGSTGTAGKKTDRKKNDKLDDRSAKGKGGTSRKNEDPEANFQKKFVRKKSIKPASGTTVPKSIEIMETIQVGELAKKLNLKPSEVIGKLMKMGEMVTITKAIDADTATLLANEYDCEVKVVSLFDETVIEEETDQEEDRIVRPPVVTIMGHVDHGKTKLLDTIRRTNVVASEAGAITQHIGAYQVETPGGKITFLDTPGHEAFTAMRARGAAVTDIVILVVAADDGVKEQTVEALRHAKEAEVPIIVAINKIDLETANPDRVKQELVAHGLQPEDWGGQTIFSEISAKQNIGIDSLLELILLQADVLELRANSNLRAVGHVIEARVDPGKGPVATILVEKGTLHEGDPYVVGIFSGRVRAMFDDRGNRLKEAGPATPIEITGIDGVPDAGDPFTSVENEKYAREIAGKRQHYKHVSEAVQRVQPSLGDLKTWIQDHKEVKVIIKADVQGSVEAIKDGLTKLSQEEVKVRVIHGATGAISESDVSLANASNAIIIGFQVRATPRALENAEQNRVEIKYYSIIYNVIEEIKQSMEGMLEPDIVEEVTGKAEVRQVFRISRIGNIAGCMIISGKINRKNKMRVIRDNVVLQTVDIKGLRREKDDVADVNEGFECGISLEGFNDIQEGDILEAFEIKEIARKL